VVQGSLQEGANQNQIQLDAAVVSATNASVLATGQAADHLQQLFTIQKTVLFRLLERMQIPLSPAERRALSERPTADLQAFLAFSRGLEAEDRGDFGAAQTEYRSALARDPNFRAASQRAGAVQLSVNAATIPPPVLAGYAPRTGDMGGTQPPSGGTAAWWPEWGVHPEQRGAQHDPEHRLDPDQPHQHADRASDAAARHPGAAPRGDRQ
jgi:hypothetical protein